MYAKFANNKPLIKYIIERIIEYSVFILFICFCFDGKTTLDRSSSSIYPWSMITDNRIFSRNFTVYGRLR